MATPKHKKVIGAEADAELVEALDKRAAEEGRSRSESIIAAVRFWLEYSEPMPADAVHKPKGKK